MTKVKSIKHFMTKAEKVPKNNHPSNKKKAILWYRENEKIAKICYRKHRSSNPKRLYNLKLQTAETLKSDEEILALRSVKKKAKEKAIDICCFRYIYIIIFIFNRF